jgi:hypothetical protein
MFGMVVVEPPDGLPRVDHEYYIMQSELYLEGDRGEPGLHDGSLGPRPERGRGLPASVGTEVG